MIVVLVSLFLSASFATSVAIIAACMMSGRVQRAIEAEAATAEAMRAIAEVELPKRRQRRHAAPAHAGV